MAKTVARFMILAKSDRMGKTVDDKGQPVPRDNRTYFAVLEFMKTKSGEIGKRVIDIMSREEYLKSLGL